MSHEQQYERWTAVLRASTATVTDLFVVVAYVVVADVVLIEGALPSAVKTLVGLPLLLFVPGYVVLAALFPRNLSAAHPDAADRLFATVSDGCLRPLERVSLSFGVSVALLPPLGLFVSWTGVGFRPGAVMATVTTVLLFGTTVAVARRFLVPESERFTVSPTAWVSRQSAALRDRSTASRVATVALVVVALAATSTLAYGLVAPGGGDAYTNVGLFTENESGALVTSGYPTTLATDESGDVVVVVENHEHRRVDYTLVVELQRVSRTDGSVTVRESVELDRARASVAPGERWRSDQTIRPELTGDDLRVAYMVYHGDPPADPGVESANESVYLSIDVAE